MLIPAGSVKARPPAAGRLVISLGYAAGTSSHFPAPWRGASGVGFIGAVPARGGKWDTSGLLLRNAGGRTLHIARVAVDFPATSRTVSLWGSFALQPGRRIVLASTNKAADGNFDGSENQVPGTRCDHIAKVAAPTIRIALSGAKAETIRDTGHVLDAGGYNPSRCAENESQTWRAPGSASGPFPPLPRPVVRLSLAPGSGAGELVGSKVALDAAVAASGKPLGHTFVTFKIRGANPASLGATTNGAGLATAGYTGTAAGVDTAIASVHTSAGDGTSNPVHITWKAPIAHAAIKNVAGDFFAEPAGSLRFLAKPGDKPAFSQNFPDIAFNPPQGLLPVPPGAPDPTAVPFTDVVTDAGGAYAGTMQAAGNGFQAGAVTTAGDLSTFDAVFRGSITVGQKGYLTLGLISGDGFIFGLGGHATHVTGILDGPPTGVSPFAGYPLMASENTCLQTATTANPLTGAYQPGDYTVTVHLPAAGSYPYEIDYFSCNDSAYDVAKEQDEPLRSLVLRAESLSSTPPNGPTVYLGYADTARLPNNLFHYFPYPWAGTPGVDFDGCAPEPTCSYDDGAIRVDNTTGKPFTIDKLTVSFNMPAGSGLPNPCTFDIWRPDAPVGVPEHGQGPIRLQPGAVAIYTEETSSGSAGCANTTGQFDTSDIPITCTPTGSIPRIRLTVDKHTASYEDKGQILNTGGIDPANCSPSYEDNESRPWTRIAGPGGGADVPLPPAAGLSLQPTQAPGGGPLTNKVGDEQVFTATATEASGANLAGVPVTFILTGANGSRRVTVTTNAKGDASFSYTGTAGGSDTIAATANYQGLQMASGLVNVDWQIPVPGGASTGGTPAEASPAVSITAPSDSSTLRTPTAVQATIAPPSGQTIKSWQVTLAGAANPNQSTTLASGARTPPSTLATVDPYHLPPGGYRLTVSATAKGGGANSATVGFVVGREARIGQFSETFQDGTTQLDGVSVQIDRTYSSFDKTVGDFGVGWRLDLSNWSVSSNGLLGLGGWRPEPSNCTLFGCEYNYVSKSVHTVTVTEPDGTPETFDFTPTGGFGPLFFLGGAGGFTPRPGTNTTGSLAVENDPGVYYGFDGNLYTSASAATDLYTATDFLYTDAHGVKYLISTTEGLLGELQPSGSCLVFYNDGVHSGGGGTALIDNPGPPSYATCANLDSGGGSIAITRDAQHRIASITTPNGEQYLYTYDKHGDLVTVTLPNSLGADRYGYDAEHNLISQKGPGAPVLKQNYDAHGRLVSITDGNGTTIRVSSEVGGRTQVLAGPPGSPTVTLVYDSGGDLVQKIEGSGGQTRTWRWAYDASGHVTHAVDPLGYSQEAVYDAAGNLTSYTDADGNTTTLAYDSRADVTSITDPTGAVTNRTYSPTGVLTSATSPTGATWTFAVGADGVPQQSTDPDGNVTKYAFSQGLPVSIQNPLGQEESFSYNADGQLTTLQSPTGSAGYGYDALGRVTEATNPLGGTTTATYDPSSGLVTSITNAHGGKTTYSYDGAGRLIAETDALGGRVALTYDVNGNIASLRQPDGATWTYHYDAFGDLVATRSPAGQQTSYSVDADGRVTSERLPTGATISYSYDPDGNILSRTTTSRGSRSATTYAYDADGRLVTVQDSGGRTSYTYNAGGELTKVNSPQGTLAYTWDPAGNRTGMSVDGKPLRYGLDVDGEVTSITDWENRKTSLTYDPGGQITGITYPDGVTVSINRDANEDITSVSAKSASGPVSAYQQNYGYDNAGDLVASSDVTGLTQYTYDPLDRLTASTPPIGPVERYVYDAAGNLLTGVLGGASASLSYSSGHLSSVDGAAVSVNAAGDITSLPSDAPGGSASFSWNPLGELTTATTPKGAESYSYDASGLLAAATGGPGHDSYLWDVSLAGGDLGAQEAGPPVPQAAGVLPDSTTLSGQSGQPGTLAASSTSAPAAWQPPAGGSPVLAGDGSNAYLSAGGLMLGQVNLRTGAAVYYLPDNLASIRATDVDGRVGAAVNYSVYGSPSASTGTLPGFTGAPRFGGLTYLRSRWLDPSTGQMLSPDTQEPSGPGTPGFNVYAYAGDNPTSLTDPSGHDIDETFAIAAATQFTVGSAIVGGAFMLACILTGTNAKNFGNAALAAVEAPFNKLCSEARKKTKTAAGQQFEIGGLYNAPANALNQITSYLSNPR